MKKIISLLFIVILALSSASCTGDDKKKLEDAKFKYLTEIMFKNGNDEFISLLSIKYDLNTELTRKIINEFIREDSLENVLSLSSTLSNTKTIEEFERLKTKFNRPSVEERIRKISVENNVEQSKIASLLIDYKIWSEAQHDETH